MPNPRESIASLLRVRDIGAGRRVPFALEKNERITPFSSEFIGLIQANLNSDWLTKYPDQSELYETLSNYASLDRDQILLVNGSDSGIKTVFETLIEPGAVVCSLQPTYAMFDVYANMFRCDIRTVQYDRRLEISHDDIVRSINKDLSLFYLANPNQPSGTFINSENIEVIVDHAQEHDVFILIDEAYIEFSGEIGSLGMIERYPNLGVLRTFSKAWGLAGLRLGYLAGDARLINQFSKTRTLLDINSFAIEITKILLAHDELMHNYVAEVRGTKAAIAEIFCKRGVEFIDTHTNFAFVRPPDGTDVDLLIQFLHQRGCIVRSISDTNSLLDGCVRFTLGTEKQAFEFAEVLFDGFDRCNQVCREG